MDIRYKVIPAAKRLDKIDEQDTELERMRKTGECTISEYVLTKHALTLKRNKEWAAVCRAMGWPIEYNPLTYDPEPKVTKNRIRDWSYVGPAIPRDELEEPLELPVNKRRRVHYLIFWCWIFVLSGLYMWLSG